MPLRMSFQVVDEKMKSFLSASHFYTILGITVLVLYLGFVRSTQIESCGKINPDASNLPWNVGIYMENNYGSLGLMCFGSLIEKNMVITAAHCFYDNLAGSMKRNNTFYLSKGIIADNIKSKDLVTSNSIFKISSKNIFINSRYNGHLNFLLADLAIIILDTKIETIIKKEDLVCVDWSNTNRNLEDSGRLPIWRDDKVKIITSEYLSDGDCPNEVSQRFSPFLTNDKFCLKSEERIIKNGGAGVVHFNTEDNSWYIRGIVSNHDLTGGKVTTVTHFNQYLNWMSNILANSYKKKTQMINH